MKNQGLSVHCHHEELIEYCYDYDERVNYIKISKPLKEQEIRLRLFKLLTKEAIEDLPIGIIKARQELDKARQELDKAGQELEMAGQKWEKARQKYNNAEQGWNKAMEEWDKAHKNWSTESQSAWHKKWCGCTEWNGKEIVFR